MAVGCGERWSKNKKSETFKAVIFVHFTCLARAACCARRGVSIIEAGDVRVADLSWASVGMNRHADRLTASARQISVSVPVASYGPYSARIGSLLVDWSRVISCSMGKRAKRVRCNRNHSPILQHETVLVARWRINSFDSALALLDIQNGGSPTVDCGTLSAPT